MSEIVKVLMRELRLSEREVNNLIGSAPERYKVYFIKKRSGGLREIAHPAPELKAAQRAVMRQYLYGLPVHPCATAYRKGSSIRDNAQRHSHNRVILKYDFKDFFPSITERAWIGYCSRHNIMSHTDAILSGRILFRRPHSGRVLRLSVGAPSSPLLSNLLLNEFDCEVHERVSAHKIVYSRYADDLTFSAERTWNLKEVEKILRSVLFNLTLPRLTINRDKTVLATPKFHRQVTGLVLTLDGRVSLGRDRKRTLRAALHHYTLGKLDKAQLVRLAGLMAFARDVEPEFYTRMELAYGRDVLATLKRSVYGYVRPST